MNQKFINASEKERQLMKQLFNQYNVNSYIFTPPDSYDREEGYYTGSTSNIPYIFEVKNRNVTSTRYSTAMIEADKVKYLIEQAKERNEEPILFFFYNDGYWFSQQLDKDFEYPTVSMPMPTTTMGNWKEYVYKDCVEFPIKNLRKYDA